MTDRTAEIAIIRAAKLLSTGEVAARAGLAESSIRTYRTRGQLPEPDVTIGTTPGWLPETIDPWIAALPGRGARTDLAATDRFLLRSALQLLLHDGATSARRDQLEQGLRDGVPLKAIARRVQIGARNAYPAVLGAEDQETVRRAAVRAAALLSSGTDEESEDE